MKPKKLRAGMSPDIEALTYDNPLRSADDCRQGFRALRRSNRSARRRLLLHAYIIAYAYRQLPEQWPEFLGQSFWKTAMKKRPSAELTVENVARYVMVFVMGATSKTSASRARRYAGALLPFLEEMKEPRFVRRKLKSPGIQKLIEAAEKQRREQKAAVQSVAEDQNGFVHLRLPPALFTKIRPLDVGGGIKLLGKVAAVTSSMVDIRIDKALPRSAKVGADAN